MELIGAEVAADDRSLPALEAPWAAAVREHPTLLAEIAHAVSGPFHLVNAQCFEENTNGFLDVLAGAGVRGQVYFGKKANKAACFVRSCAKAGAGVDVASIYELAHVLANGVRGEEVVVTGAAKSDDLLWLAARQRCLIAVDALDELERVIALARETGLIRVLLRVVSPLNPHSRFGFAAEELARAEARCAAERRLVAMQGYSFHLDGYDVAPRAELAAQLAERCVRARELGLAATSVDIGGGFAVRYMDEDVWRRFCEERDSSWFHAGKNFEKFYPYCQSPTGAQMLGEILDRPAGARPGSVGELFAQTGTSLFLEPGRALLDGAGVTVFPVQGFKRQGDHGVITVGGLSMSVSEQWKGSEFLPDPVLWPRSEEKGRVLACVGGSSCLEYDMISWRKIPFPRIPRLGDFLIYPNTAGYQMHKNESEFHQIPLPPVVEVYHDQGRLRWRVEMRASL